MKTVITDNSLCTLPIDDSVRPSMIYKYISALGEAGVKYVELDFRTIMKMTELPDDVNYIFRLNDPMFAELTEVFDFSYVTVTMNDLKQRLHINTPVLLEFPALAKLSPAIIGLAQSQIHGRISMARLRGSYPLLGVKEAAAMVHGLKNSVPVPVDICPMNKHKTALDSALKFSRAGIDSLTMCMGVPGSYASIEEFVFTLMSVHEVILKEINMAGLCKAAVYHQLVFGKAAGDSIAYVMRLLDTDILGLRNADTGQRVPLKVTLKDKMRLQKNFVSALENFIDSEEIPDDLAYDICEAIKRYDTSLFDQQLMYTPPKGTLQ